MKKISALFGQTGVGVLSIILAALACLLGADSAFAMAADLVGANDTTGSGGIVNKAGDVPPSDPDDRGLITRGDGVGPSEASATETEFTAEEIDRAIAESRPFTNPLEHDIVTMAKQVHVTNREVTHYRAGTKIFTTTTTKSVTSASDGEYEVVDLEYGSNKELATKADLKLFNEDRTVHAPLLNVIASDGKNFGNLSMYVVKNDGSKAQLIVLNPPVVSGTVGHVTVPAGTKLVFGTNVGHESQMHTAPDNMQPVGKTVYTEKRLCNIVFTDAWNQAKKKIEFDENDLRRDALYNFQVGNEINDLVGQMSKFKVEAGKHMSDEFVYTAEGIIPQISMQYAYDETNGITPADLNAIAKFQFTTFSVSDYARAYCGQDFLEMLMNMDLTVHKDIKFERVTEGGLSINGWRNNFGKIDFVYNPVFDLLGLEAFAAVLDIRNAVHYVNNGQRTFKIDMKKGAGDNYEAERDVYTKTECVCLKGRNSILVGPSSALLAISDMLTNVEAYATAWDGVTSKTWAAGDFAYLTADFTQGSGSSAVTFPKGSIIKYDGTSWSLYKREIVG